MRCVDLLKFVRFTSYKGWLVKSDDSIEYRILGFDPVGHLPP